MPRKIPKRTTRAPLTKKQWYEYLSMPPAGVPTFYRKCIKAHERAIIAWIQGATIIANSIGNKWYVAKTPHFLNYCRYRIAGEKDENLIRECASRKHLSDCVRPRSKRRE
ncbi:MAG: hypothetical protein ACRC6V_13540 [Bacteroidales bacterium]